ncbi:hypothetical protein ACVWW4_003642 [Bradyrhizobium sp. LB7.1]
MSGPDHEAERILNTGQQFPEPLALGGMRVEQQQPAIGVAPAGHVGDHEQVTAGHLDDRAREFQPILLAGDETGAKSRFHVDLDFWKGEIGAAAGLRTDRIAALADRF